MENLRADEAFVGLVALGSIVWIFTLLRRAAATGRLPLGKAYVDRDERMGAFRFLFGLYVVAACAMLYIGLDLLTGFGE